MLPAQTTGLRPPSTLGAAGFLKMQQNPLQRGGSHLQFCCSKLHTPIKSLYLFLYLPAIILLTDAKPRASRHLAMPKLASSSRAGQLQKISAVSMDRTSRALFLPLCSQGLPRHREMRAFFSCIAWRAIPRALSKLHKRGAKIAEE